MIYEEVIFFIQEFGKHQIFSIRTPCEAIVRRLVVCNIEKWLFVQGYIYIQIVISVGYKGIFVLGRPTSSEGNQDGQQDVSQGHGSCFGVSLWFVHFCFTRMKMVKLCVNTIITMAHSVSPGRILFRQIDRALNQHPTTYDLTCLHTCFVHSN